MNDKELELMKKAMLHEDEGAEYYMLQSQQWHDALVCENFRQLAEEERLHAKWLRDLFDAKKTLGDRRIMFAMTDIKSPGLFDWTSIKRMDNLGLKDVFKKAMDMEEKSYKYYQEVRENTRDDDLRQLLDILIDWEISHYNSFKSVYELL